MAYHISLDTPAALPAYSKISIAFWVTSRFRVEVVNQGLAGLQLVEENVSPPIFKNYDDYEKPLDWPNLWDISNWAILSAMSDRQRIGGAVVAWNTTNMTMLEGRQDLAVLWDIRVDAHHRGQGVGTALFRWAAQWATEQGCTQLKIETQNINVPACRFYAGQGCTLRAIDLAAYPELPHEVQLIWSKTLV